jgi:hypothetical protein
MSALVVVLIVVAVVLLPLFLGGLVVARRRLARPGFAADVGRADRALERARATDRGWDRDLLHGAARAALSDARPGIEWQSLELVLVDDRPGIEEDRAHVVAACPGAEARVVLRRDRAGAWVAERVE